MTAPGSVYVQVVAFGLEAAWRHEPPPRRAADAAELEAAERESSQRGVVTRSFSCVGLEPGVDVILLRLADSLDAIEDAAVRLARSGLGGWLIVRHSLLGRVAPSKYVVKPSAQERSLLDGEPRRYFVAYPFTKSADWYLLGREARQGIMNEHMRVGRSYPGVRQLLAHSFGLDDQDFIVAYDMDDLDAFGELVRELRATESRRSTVSDRPILLGIHRTLPEILERLTGASGPPAGGRSSRGPTGSGRST